MRWSRKKETGSQLVSSWKAGDPKPDGPWVTKRRSCLLIYLKTSSVPVVAEQHFLQVATLGMCTRDHRMALCAHTHVHCGVPGPRVQRGTQHIMCFCLLGHCWIHVADEILFTERHWEVSRCSGWWNKMISYKLRMSVKFPSTVSEYDVCAVTSALH